MQYAPGRRATGSGISDVGAVVRALVVDGAAVGGTMVGDTVGVLVGALVGGLIGALVGGLVGGLVGAFVDGLVGLAAVGAIVGMTVDGTAVDAKSSSADRYTGFSRKKTSQPARSL